MCFHSLILLLTLAEDSKQKSKDMLIYFSRRTIVLEDFTGAMLFANRENCQVQNILKEVTEHSFQATRVFLVAVLLCGAL